MDSPTQRKRKRPLLETVQEDDGNSKFARALGSVDNQTREKGLQALTIWLSKKDDLTEQDLRRLWKGIFYCFWHADKAAFQADLAVRLAEILPMLSYKVAYLYFTVFLSTIRREWFGIDRLRLDKFMMLVRKFVRALFLYLQAQKWDVEIVTQFMTYIQNDVMLSTDSHPAAGLTYHIADVFMVELKEVCRGGAPAADVLQALLEPFCQTLAKTNRAAFLPRLREAVFDAVIDEVLRPSEKMPLRHLGINQFADHLFQLGASAKTHAKNRQELYEVSKALEQAAKKRQTAPARQAKKGTSSKHKAGFKVGSSALVDQPGSPAISKKRKGGTAADGTAAASGQINGSVESTDAFAAEAAAALHQAADDMPQAAMAQVNGKQIKKLKKKKKQQAAAVAGTLPGEASLAEQQHQAQLAVANGHRDSVGADAKAQDGASQKKRVRFAMKRNLWMQIGGAVPPEEIRTPPDSRPKGSALKRSSLLDHRENQMKSSGTKHKPRKHAKSGHKPSTAQAKLFF
ncbi:hypothetical protein WJX79_001241 [Trebouxia sp. C0005]